MEKKIFDYNSFIKENPVEKLAKATSTAVPEQITKEIEKHDNEAIETIEDPDLIPCLKNSENKCLSMKSQQAMNLIQMH